MKRREARKAQRHYAVLGYLAEHPLCPAEEIAHELGYELNGLVVDLAVEKTIWRRVDSEWEDFGAEAFNDPQGNEPPKRPRRLYRLTTPAEREAKR